MNDTIAMLEEILGEADALIRQREKDRGISFPHLVVAVTPQGQIVHRSNVSPEALRSFSEDLERVANELTGQCEVDAITNPLTAEPMTLEFMLKRAK
jgi:hypothetical protein